MTFIPPTEFAEDVAHTSGDKGIQSLAVRKDTAVALAADGDYEPLIVDSTGKLHVNVGTSALPSGAATSALQTQPGVDIGDVTINNASGASAVNIQDGGNSITVDGTVAFSNSTIAVTNTGTFAVQATLAAETTKVIGTVNQGTSPWVTSNATTSVVGNGAAATAQRVTLANDSTGVIATVGAVTAITNALPTGSNTIGAVNIAAAQTLATVTTVGTVTTLTGTTTLTPGTGAANLGKAEDTAHASGDTGVFALAVGNEAQTTLAADGDYIGLAVDTKGNLLTTGNIAHDGVDAGRPMKVGGRARTSEIAAVSSDDRVDAIYDKVGKQVVLPYAVPENFVSGAITTAMTGTTSTSLVSAPAGSLRNYITTIIVSNSHATVGTDVIIQDGSGGTTLLTIPAAAAYGGATITLPTPLRQPTTATAIYCANVTTGSSTKVSAVGYTGL